jgi:hypothetical protein
MNTGATPFSFSGSEASALPACLNAENSIELPKETAGSLPFNKPILVEIGANHPNWPNSCDFWNEVAIEVSRPISLDEIRALATKLRSHMDENRRLLFSERFRDYPEAISPAYQGETFIAVPESERDLPLWFLGDIHGDLLAFLVAQKFIKQQEGIPRFVFLGDLFDRGKFNKEVLFHVLELIVNNPEQHCLVVGNHDEGLRVTDGKFSSSVEPCEFADFLNAEDTDQGWRDLAEQAIRVFFHAPRAMLLPDGLLVAHGGVPHVDRLPAIGNKDDLSDRDCGEDFVWTRLHESARKKIPNRSTRGCSLGVTDFYAFCDKLSEILSRPVKGMIRGHDHIEKRFAFFEGYTERPVLTINTMCHRYDGEMFGDFERPVIVAKYVAGQMPVVHRIEVPKQLIFDVYSPKASPDG